MRHFHSAPSTTRSGGDHLTQRPNSVQPPGHLAASMSLAAAPTGPKTHRQHRAVIPSGRTSSRFRPGLELLPELPKPQPQLADASGTYAELPGHDVGCLAEG